MKRIRRAYSKTVSLIDETAVQIYESFVGKRRGFLLESYDKNNGRYVFMGKDPEEVILILMAIWISVLRYER